MDCPMCKELERAFETRRRNYIAARFAAYYRVSTELAAYKNVEMERAKSDLEEHQSVCVFAASGLTASWPNSTLGRHAESIWLSKVRHLFKDR
jgi:Zn-dependent peptidase ImmA (M78 family)